MAASWRGEKLSAFASTSSAELASVISDKTGTGALVFANAPSLTSASVSGAVTSSSPTAGIGYATGAGGSVTQITGKGTAVTINKICGTITTANTSLAVSTARFTVNNSVVVEGDVVTACTRGNLDSVYQATACNVINGAFDIRLTNVVTTQSEAVLIDFYVFKTANS